MTLEELQVAMTDMNNWVEVTERAWQGWCARPRAGTPFYDITHDVVLKVPVDTACVVICPGGEPLFVHKDSLMYSFEYADGAKITPENFEDKSRLGIVDWFAVRYKIHDRKYMAFQVPYYLTFSFYNCAINGHGNHGAGDVIIRALKPDNTFDNVGTNIVGGLFFNDRWNCPSGKIISGDENHRTGYSEKPETLFGSKIKPWSSEHRVEEMMTLCGQHMDKHVGRSLNTKIQDWRSKKLTTTPGTWTSSVLHNIDGCDFVYKGHCSYHHNSAAPTLLHVEFGIHRRGLGWVFDRMTTAYNMDGTIALRLQGSEYTLKPLNIDNLRSMLRTSIHDMRKAVASLK